MKHARQNEVFTREDIHIRHVRDFSPLWWACVLGIGILGVGIFYAGCVLLPLAFSGIF
jgi:hypothetical protein